MNKAEQIKYLDEVLRSRGVIIKHLDWDCGCCGESKLSVEVDGVEFTHETNGNIGVNYENLKRAEND